MYARRARLLGIDKRPGGNGLSAGYVHPAMEFSYDNHGLQQKN